MRKINFYALKKKGKKRRVEDKLKNIEEGKEAGGRVVKRS